MLSFGALADRTRVDPLGAGYQWSRLDQGVEVSSRNEFARMAGRRLVSEIGLSKDQIQRIQPTVIRWAEALPAEWMEQPMDDLDRRGSHSIRKVKGMAKAQLALMQKFAAELNLSPDQLRKLRGYRQVFVPFLTK